MSFVLQLVGLWALVYVGLFALSTRREHSGSQRDLRVYAAAVALGILLLPALLPHIDGRYWLALPIVTMSVLLIWPYRPIRDLLIRPNEEAY